MMVMPLIGAAARMAAKKLAEKGGKKTVKKAAKKGMSAEDARLVGVSGLRWHGEVLRSALNGLMVLLKKARRKAGWFNVLNQQHSVL
jgi:hypothetical protein